MGATVQASLVSFPDRPSVRAAQRAGEGTEHETSKGGADGAGSPTVTQEAMGNFRLGVTKEVFMGCCWRGPAGGGW